MPFASWSSLAGGLIAKEAFIYFRHFQITGLFLIVNGKGQLKGFPGGSVVESLPAIAGDTGSMDSIPGLGRSPGVGNGNPL